MADPEVAESEAVGTEIEVAASTELEIKASDIEVRELPDDYYVTLQPLTLEMIATQCDRIGWKYQAEPDRISAHWENGFLLTIHVLSGDILHVRATLLKLYPIAGLGVLTARCNWWNLNRLFLKASAASVVGLSESDGSQAYALARVYLDADLPLKTGVAPVQLQELLRAIVTNVSTFISQASLDTLLDQSSWE